VVPCQASLTTVVHNWDAKTFQEVRSWLGPKIAKAPPPPAPTSRAGSPTFANDPPEKAALITNIIEAFSNTKVSNVDNEPQQSMVAFPVDDDDSDWEGGGQFMVMNSDGEYVAYYSDDE
jgi:hypothetical protein